MWRPAFFLAAVLACLVTTQSEARALRFSYTATVLSVSLLNGATDDLGFAVGDQVSGSFIYDEGDPDADADPLKGFYPNSVSNMRFGSFFAPKPAIDYSYLSVGAETDSVASYANVIEGGISDVYALNMYSVTGPDVIADDSFNLAALDLADYPECTSTSSCLSFQRAWLEAGGPSPVVTQIHANLTSLRITPIPEPSTMMLLGVALLGLLARPTRAGHCR